MNAEHAVRVAGVVFVAFAVTPAVLWALAWAAVAVAPSVDGAPVRALVFAVYFGGFLVVVAVASVLARLR